MKSKRASKTVILVAINDFLVGGAQRLMVDLFREWGAEDYEFHLLTFREFPGKKDFLQELPDYVKYHHLSVRGAGDIGGILRLRSHIRRIDPDLILSNLYLSNTLIRLSLFGRRVPVITVEHNTYTNKNVFQHAMDRALSSKSSSIVAVSEGVAAFLETAQKIPRKKITVIANGIDVAGIKEYRESHSRLQIREALGIPPDETVVLHVGRLVQQKDPLLMLHSYASFADSFGRSSRLIVVGDGDLRRELIAEAERLGLKDKASFVGEQSPHQFYIASDVFLSTSAIEGFGLVRAEALAHQIPVVTTGTGGSDELIENHKNGIVVPSRHPDDLAHGIVEALAIPRDAFLASADTVERFSITATATAYERLMNDTLRLP